MQKLFLVVIASLCLWSTAVLAQEPAASAAPEAPGIKLTAQALGDTAEGVVYRVLAEIDELQPPAEVPLAMQGSIMSDGTVLRTFRYTIRPGMTSYAFVQTVPEGKTELELRVLVALEESTPIMLGKALLQLDVRRTGKEYVASEEDGAEAIMAEGALPEHVGAVRLRAPRRDLAPNLFIVEAEVKEPVRRVEFYVEGKKIFTRNAPPFQAELDLGQIPRRVEVRAVGYDSRGRYVDADAWVVNERQNAVEARITRTVTPDGIAHFRVSVQNHQNTPISRVVFSAGDRKIAEWTRPPYAIDLAAASLASDAFVTATVLDATGKELASDLMFLEGDRYIEELQVNLIELPVTVVDKGGLQITDLQREDFQVFEDGKPQKIDTFGFAANLPLTLGLLVDHSGSMQPRIEEARNAAVSFFDQILGPNDRAFFGGFSWDTTNVSPFLSSAAVLRAQVAGMPDPDGGTAIYDAVVTGLYKFRSVPGRKALIIVTDGEDTVSRLPFDQMLSYVRSARVPIYLIGIGMSSLAGSKVRSLAAETGGVAYMIKSPEQLAETYKKLEQDLRSQYLIGYYSQSTKKDAAYRNVEVKTKRPGATARTIRGYIP